MHSFECPGQEVTHACVTADFMLLFFSSHRYAHIRKQYAQMRSHTHQIRVPYASHSAHIRYTFNLNTEQIQP
jgi:hypothetical protein